MLTLEFFLFFEEVNVDCYANSIYWIHSINIIRFESEPSISYSSAKKEEETKHDDSFYTQSFLAFLFSLVHFVIRYVKCVIHCVCIKCAESWKNCSWDRKKRKNFRTHTRIFDKRYLKISVRNGNGDFGFFQSARREVLIYILFQWREKNAIKPLIDMDFLCIIKWSLFIFCWNFFALNNFRLLFGIFHL